MHDPLASLERLTRLRDAGALSEEEFAAQKAKILGGHGQNKEDRHTRRWIATRSGKIATGAALLALVIALVAWWWFSPYWTLRNMQSALAAKDADDFSKYVDFESLRSDLKADAIADLERESQNSSEGKENGFAAIGAAMIGPLIDGMISPQGMRTLFAMEKPAEGDPGIMKAAAGGQLIRDGLTKFRVEGDKGDVFIFSLNGIRWQLSGIDAAPREALREVEKSSVAEASRAVAPPSADIAATETLGTEGGWLVGTWSGTGCDGTSIQRFERGGAYTDNNYRGTWELLGSTLTIKPTHTREEGEADMVIPTPRSETYSVERNSRDQATLQLEGGSGYTIQRCR